MKDENELNGANKRKHWIDYMRKDADEAEEDEKRKEMGWMETFLYNITNGNEVTIYINRK